MPDLYMDVDVAVQVPVNILPLLDDTDGKTIETAIVYNSAGLAITWNFVTCAGVMSQTAVTPTTGSNHDWLEPTADRGMYGIEIPASGGTVNNDTEGFGWITGVATGVLPFRGPTIGFRAAGLNDKMIENAYSTTRGLGGTALPDAAADAAGGLPISDAGGLDLDSKFASLPIKFKKNVALLNFAFPMFDGAGALKTGLTVIASIRKDSGSFAALAGSVTEISTTGWYTVNWEQAETNADVIAFSASASGANPTCYTILPQE